MMRRPQIALLADGKRLHLQDGPIDLIVEARGGAADIAAAHGAAMLRFDGLLDELCAELPALRQAADPARCSLQGRVARRMHQAVAPFASDHFITPMAAVAGAVAEEILAAMLDTAPLQRAYVNNGGDIALYLADGEQLTVGLLDRPERRGVMQLTTIDSADRSRGIATSGRHGRSFSLGIADAVTVLARTAAQADAAATIIANAVDLPAHPAIRRCPANELQPDSDLGGRLVTREVGALSEAEIDAALGAGLACARRLLAAGLIDGAALRLQGETVVAGTRLRLSNARQSDRERHPDFLPSFRDEPPVGGSRLMAQARDPSGSERDEGWVPGSDVQRARSALDARPGTTAAGICAFDRRWRGEVGAKRPFQENPWAP